MPKLARGFGVVGATAIVVSNMIGTGILFSALSVLALFKFPAASALALGAVAGGALAYHLYSSRDPNRLPGVADAMELG